MNIINNTTEHCQLTSSEEKLLNKLSQFSFRGFYPHQTGIETFGDIHKNVNFYISYYNDVVDKKDNILGINFVKTPFRNLIDALDEEEIIEDLYNKKFYKEITTNNENHYAALDVLINEIVDDTSNKGNALQENGVIISPSGCYISARNGKPAEAHLFIDSIESFYSTRKYHKNRESIVCYAYVRLMFHAFFDCNTPTFKQVEEPITQYAMLSFMEQLFISDYYWYTIFIESLTNVIRDASLIYSLGVNLFRNYNNPTSELYRYDWILNYKTAKSNLKIENKQLQHLFKLYTQNRLIKNDILIAMKEVIDETISK